MRERGIVRASSRTVSLQLRHPKEHGGSRQRSQGRNYGNGIRSFAVGLGPDIIPMPQKRRQIGVGYLRGLYKSMKNVLR